MGAEGQMREGRALPRATGYQPGALDLTKAKQSVARKQSCSGSSFLAQPFQEAPSMLPGGPVTLGTEEAPVRPRYPGGPVTQEAHAPGAISATSATATTCAIDVYVCAYVRPCVRTRARTYVGP